MAVINQQEILQNIQTGTGNKALSHLYDNTLPKVRKYILKNSGNRDEANDIFQDAVIIFFSKVKENKFDSKMDVDAFIYTVARNLWIDKARRERRMVNYDHVGQFEHQTDFNNQLTDMIDKEKTGAMRKVFEMLDEKCQKILHYYIYEKRSMREISQLMGYSSEDVVKTNHYRCKQYLGKLVKSSPELVSLLRN